MSRTTNDFTLDKNYFDTFTSCRACCGMSGGSTANDDQFLLSVHVVEVTATVVVAEGEIDEVVVLLVVEVLLEVVVDVVVVTPNVGKVVVGIAALFGQYLDGYPT